MRALVTGGAGFIGARLVEHLQDRGHAVRVVDRTVDGVGARRGVEVVRADLGEDHLEPLLDGVDTVFHLAARPGVRRSWAEGFARYVDDNIVATQRLLEAMGSVSARLVYASSSSVYGDAGAGPSAEAGPVHPRSPYGVTKLAGEHLCAAYGRDRGLTVVSLRLFTVYGPGQRPDMALHRLFESALGGSRFEQYGDGGQERDLTYVGDVVRAFEAAATAPVTSPTTINVCGGTTVSLARLIDRVGTLVGRPPPVEARGRAEGDVARTLGDGSQARRLLGWSPEIDLDDGLKHQLAWHQSGRP